MKYVLIIIAALCFLTEARAQENSFDKNSSTIYIGYPAGFFDSPNLGLYVGYNKEFLMKPRFSFEGQGSISYSKFDRDSNTFAHDGGSTYVVSLLVGPRLYIIKPEKKTRFFINLLLGPGYIFDSEYRNLSTASEEFLSEEHIFTLGLSLGAYLQISDKFVFGSAFETGGSQVFKIGFKF